MMGRPVLQLTGRTFGRLTVMHLANPGQGAARWMCKCICGAFVEAATSSLKRYKVTSCGCRRREETTRIANAASRAVRRKAAEEVLNNGYKVCRKCEKLQLVNKFPFSQRNLDRSNSYCKDCVSDMRIRRYYGVGLQYKKDYLQAMSGKCCGCLVDISLSKSHLDHCHKTGFVRGVLCGKCNAALGLIRDDKLTLLRLKSYLEDAELAYGLKDEDDYGLDYCID